MTPWNPLRKFDQLHRKLNSWLDQPLRLPPRADVYPTKNDIIIKAEISGVAKEDLESRRKILCRTIPFPVAIKPDEAVAQYKDGTAPKVEPSKSEADECIYKKQKAI